MLKFILPILILVLPFGSVIADTLEISVSQQAPELQDIHRPTSGMTKEGVQQVWGAPMNISGPVGTPPIERWTYAEFAVYFEFETVLHSVLKTSASVKK